MKRRIVSILMALTMALSLLPAQVLAQELTQLGQNSAYTTGEDAVPLTYGNGQDTALHAIALQSIGNGQSVEVGSEGGLTNDLNAESSVIKLTNNIDLNSTLTISYAVTIDLNGHVLRMADDASGSVFKIENGGHLTIIDSSPTATHKFRVEENGLWVWDETNGTKTVTGGVITGGTGTSTSHYTNGGGVLIEPGGYLTMTGGSIVGCKATNISGSGGGVMVESGGGFAMENGAAIIGCVANSGGGVMTDNADDTIYGEFVMNGGTIASCKTTEKWGGGVYASGPFTMNGGVITNCEAFELGGGVFLGSSTSPHTLNGTITSGDNNDTKHIFANSAQVTIGADAKISANITLEGGTIEMDANATFNGTATVSGTMCALANDKDGLTAALKNTNFDTIRLMANINLPTTDDALSINRSVTLDLNGCVLSRSTNASDRIFTVESNGHLTIKDSNPNAVHKFTPDNDGLWVWDRGGNNGTNTVTGGVITGGSAEKGGGVYIDGGGKLTMTGGHIVGCEARGYNAYGGGVFAKAGGTFTMSGGSITGCAAITTRDSARGGGIRSEGNTTLSDTAEIRDCHAKGAGSKVYNLSGGGISDGGTLNISDNVQIIGCTAGGKDSDAMFVSGGSITGGTFYGSIKGLDKATITGHTVTYRLNNEDYATQVVPANGTTGIPDPAKADHTFSGWYKDGAPWEAATPVTENLTLTGLLYAPVKTAEELTAALENKDIEAIRLMQNIKLSGVLEIAADSKVILDLNGHVLDLGKKYISLAYNSINHRYAQKQLTIVDSDPTKEHRFTDNNGLWVLDEQNGTKTVKGGVITGGSADKGGAVYIDTNGTVIMNGGNIVGCFANNGGAVYMNGIKFEMNGGAIIGCKATNGGAVYVEEKGTFTMTDGSIADCTADQGSALYLKGTMYANGGTVDGTVVLDDNDEPESGIQSLQGNNNTTQFTGTVTNNGGNIKHGTFSGLIISNSTNARFYNVHTPLGIVGEKPSNTNYRTVTFDPAEGTMDYTIRYFLNGKNISSEIKPTRTGYTFVGWYNGETKWDHATATVTGDLTLTAHWTACDHANSAAKPTCTASAICTVCGGEIPARGHTWSEWTPSNNNTHTHTCIVDKFKESKACTDTNKDHLCDTCGATLSQCADTDKDHKCDYCGATLSQCADPDKDHKCDYCGATLSQCADPDKDHKCDYCGATLSQCADPDKDHKCDYCGATLSQCADTDKDHKCDYCGATLSQCADTDKDHKCDYCGATLSQCADPDKDHKCDYCGATLSQCADADKDHKCDYCGKTISNHDDADKDHNCDLCGKVLTVHTGGKATCIASAVCEICGQSYGDIDPAAHADLRHIPAKAATTEAVGNIEYWYCAGCDKYYQDAAAKRQITQADTVTPQRIPHHYSGPTIMVVGTSYYDGGNTGLTFISSAAYSGFKGVQVDGETLAAKNYTSRENGGSQVCLKPDYLRGLTNGDHIVTILSAEGDVAAVFTVSVTGVSGSKDSPTTFDPGVTVYAAAALVSLTGLSILPRKRREDD